MLEPRELSCELRHAAAGVDQREHRLRSLDRVLARDQLGALGGGLPVDVARVIAPHVLTQSGETLPLAAPTEVPHSGGVEPVLHREQTVAPYPRDRGGHPDLVSGREAETRTDESPGRGDARSDGTEWCFTSREPADDDRHGQRRECGDHVLRLPDAATQAGWQAISELHVQTDTARIPHPVDDRCLVAEADSRRRLSRDHHAAR